MKKCKRCGQCCRSDKLLDQCTEEEKILFKGIYKMLGKDINNTRCPNLEYVMGLAVCKIYENRPWFCREHFCKKAGG